MAFVTANGIRIHYEDEGSGDRIFVFVHGGASDLRAWGPQVANLSRSYRCLSFDLRGCGESEAAPPYHLAQQADDVADALRQLGVTGAIVAGHSLGGLTALVLNDRHPDLVAGIVTGDSPLAPSGVDATDIADALKAAGSTAPLAERLATGVPADVADTITAMILACPLDVAVGMLERATLDAEAMLRLVTAADAKPFMTIWPVGTEGDSHPAGGDPAWLRDVTVFVRQEPVFGGHFFQLEQPDVTSALLRAFVDDVERDPRLQS